jgi:hypothetical protein
MTRSPATLNAPNRLFSNGGNPLALMAQLQDLTAIKERTEKENLHLHPHNWVQP